VHPADVQDRDGMREVLGQARRTFPFIERIFADAGYQGPKGAKAVADTGRWVLEIVKRTDAHNFVVLPKRWIVERTWPGSVAIAAWHAISNAMPEPSPPSCASP
jgi:transposase